MLNLNEMVLDPNKRHDFVYLFEVVDGNPNGDPDAGNLPRIDPETRQGLVTDVALKRRVRNFVLAVKEDQPPFCIYVKERGILAREQAKAYQAVGAQPGLAPNEDARRWMMQNYYDVRMFGAVMTTGDSGQKDRSEKRTLQWNCGQVRGPVQFKFARSVDPILPLELAITRVALTNPQDVARAKGADEEEEMAVAGQIGRKAIVPYALYKAEGFFVPRFAQVTGVTREDLELFWNALAWMWDLDRSSARGRMACRGLYVFTHENPLGNAPAHLLLERIRVERRTEGPPRRFEDYQILVDEADLPKGVTLTRLVG